MKTSTFLGSFVLVNIFFTAITSCKEPNTSSYSATLAGSESKALIADEDMRFLFAAHNMSLFNTYLAGEALIRSTAGETASMAHDIKESSEKISNEIIQVADQYNLSLPIDITEEQKAVWKRMVKQKGWRFDQEFASIVEDNCKKSTALFVDGVKSIEEKEIRKIAEQGLADTKNYSNLLLAQHEKMKERIGDTDSSIVTGKMSAPLAFEKKKK